MTTYLLAALLAAGLFLLDYYVYRNWRLFTWYRGAGRWTLPFYRVLMGLMPLVLPAYFAVSRWYAVEPKAVRALVIGSWLVYYIPKGIIALALVLKDLALGARWLFRWFQHRLQDPEPAAPSASQNLDLTDMKRMSRAEFLQKMGWTAASLPFVMVGYSVFRTLYDFEIHRVDIPIKGLPRAFDGLQIAQLSDLHAGSFFSARPMEEAVEHVRALRPNLIVITGDYVNNDADEIELILPALHRLEADLGVFGCLGNHDHYARVRDVATAVRSTPVDLLVNEHRTLRVDGAKLHLIGTDNTGFNQYYGDLPRAVAGLVPDTNGEEARLLLAHDPTFWDIEVRNNFAEIDLTLSGHTHGGQIGFEAGPLRWSMARVVYARWAGLYTEARAERPAHHLYINRGLGTVGPPLRLGIRPEITLLTLQRT